MLKYAALIVTFNRKDKLVKALDSLLSQSILPEKIVLVDNASTDGTQDMLKAGGYLDNERLQFIELPTNVGGSGGFYAAFEAAKQLDVDWVSISDDDANFGPDYFAAMAKAIERHPDAGGFTSEVKLPDGRIDVTHRFHMIDKHLLRWREIPAENYDMDFKVDGFTFVGSFLSMRTIREVDAPEKDFFIWWDDLDYSVRVTKTTDVYNAPGAVINHDTPSNAMDLKHSYHPDWRNYYGTRNMFFAFWKNAHPVLKYPYLLYKIARLYLNLVSPRLKYGRKYELFTANQAMKDFFRGKKGLNEHFLPGSSKQREAEYAEKVAAEQSKMK